MSFEQNFQIPKKQPDDQTPLQNDVYSDPQVFQEISTRIRKAAQGKGGKEKPDHPYPVTAMDGKEVKPSAELQQPAEAKKPGNNSAGSTTYKDFLKTVDDAQKRGNFFTRDSDLILNDLTPAGLRDQALNGQREARLGAIKNVNARTDISGDRKEQTYFQLSRLISASEDGAILADQLLMADSSPEKIEQAKQTCTATGHVSLLLYTEPQLVAKDVADMLINHQVVDHDGKVTTAIDPASIKGSFGERQAQFGEAALSRRDSTNRSWAQRLAELGIANRHWQMASKDAQGRDIEAGALSYINDGISDRLVRRVGDELVPETDLNGNDVNHPGIPFGGMAKVYQRMTGQSDSEVKSRFIIDSSASELDRQGLTTEVSSEQDLEKLFSEDPKKERLLYVSLDPKTSIFGQEFAELSKEQQLQTKGGGNSGTETKTPAHILTMTGFDTESRTTKIDNYFRPDHL